MRKEFNKCLNNQSKIYNIPVWGVILGAIFLFFVCAIKGLLWGVAAGAVGMITGIWLQEQWHQGNAQRWLYWHLPYMHVLIDKNMPASHHRKLM